LATKAYFCRDGSSYMNSALTYITSNTRWSGHDTESGASLVSYNVV